MLGDHLNQFLISRDVMAVGQNKPCRQVILNDSFNLKDSSSLIVSYFTSQIPMTIFVNTALINDPDLSMDGLVINWFDKLGLSGDIANFSIGSTLVVNITNSVT